LPLISTSVFIFQLCCNNNGGRAEWIINLLF
jgi:hypothetical protein